MRVLLDTNAYSALRRGHETVATEVRRSEKVLLSSIVVGELLFGFRNGSRFDVNFRSLREFLDDENVQLATVTWTTAEHFGRIAADLRSLGRPIPTNDIWIAAHAVEHGARLLSADRHFENIEGLDWLSIGPR